jgi:hypothetical protein
MTDDLVTEARKGGPCAELGDRCRAIEAASGCFCAAVADRIEALTDWREQDGKLIAVLGEALEIVKADNARLRDALKGLMAHEPDYSDTLWQEARAALTGKEPSQ